MVPAESGSQQQRAIDLIETAINVEETAIERILRLVFGIDPTGTPGLFAEQLFF